MFFFLKNFISSLKLQLGFSIVSDTFNLNSNGLKQNKNNILIQ